MTDKENTTATETLMRSVNLMDLRRLRARSMTASLMNELGDLIPTDLLSEFHNRIFEVFHKNGAAYLTDEDRQRLGLEARDEIGWTQTDRLLHKRRQIEVMQMISAAPFLKNPDSR